MTEQKEAVSSERKEWRNLFLSLLFFVAIFGIAAIDDLSNGINTLGNAFWIAYLIGVVWLVISLTCWMQAENKQISGIELEKLKKKIFGAWYARYSLAIVLVCFAIVIPETKNHKWWESLIPLLWAAFLAREVSIVLLVGAGAYLLYKGVAALPVSIAVIVGAVIIAIAIKRRHRNG